MENEQKPSTEETSAEESRKGTAIGATVFALVIIAAVIAYNALTAGDMGDVNLQEAGASASAAGNAGSGTGTADSGAAASTASNASTSATSIEVPDFVIVNAEGDTVSIRQFEGKPTVLNFWASTCGPCQSEMPHFQAAYEEYGDRANFVMVDIPGFNGETTTRAERFLANNGYTFPAYFDLEGDASRVFSLTSIPRTYFIDAEGNIVTTGNGALSESALQRGLAALGL